jgi:hypothetical protein
MDCVEIFSKQYLFFIIMYINELFFPFILV